MARVEALEGFREDVEPRLRAVERTTPTPEEKRDLELRIRALEKVQLKYAGAIGVIVFVCTVIGAVIARKLGG